MHLLVLGCGNMGSAMVQALSRRKEPLFERVFVFDTHASKATALAATGATPLASFKEISFQRPYVVLLAVKPQDLDELLSHLKGRLVGDSLLISIAAGVRLARLQEKSGHKAVVRVMPNTPALVGLGASAWLASSDVSDHQKKQVHDLLESFGIAVEVANEDQLDAVTALSGSGPAYVFYFLEALCEGGTALGLSQEVAYRLALQTLLGSATLAQQNSKTLEGVQALRAQVTSKGGTTEAGFGMMEKGAFKKLIENAMEAAYRRAKEL